MKRIAYLSFALIIIFCFSACHKNSTAPNMQTMIVGKWILQKQSYVQYVNDVKQVDTVCLASDTLTADVQFNADKSFKSEGVSFSKSPLSPSNMEVQVSGTYIASNSTLTVSKTMAGILFFLFDFKKYFMDETIFCLFPFNWRSRFRCDRSCINF